MLTCKLLHGRLLAPPLLKVTSFIDITDDSAPRQHALVHPNPITPLQTEQPTAGLPGIPPRPTMSSLQYFNDRGAGQKLSDICHYSQAVVLGDTVKCSGQGGWTIGGEVDPYDIRGQVNLAFDNVDRVLQAAGLRGWEDVYSVRSYHVGMDQSYNYVAAKLRKRIPGHRPIWTAVAVPRLAFPEMRIELEVEAWNRRS